METLRDSRKKREMEQFGYVVTRSTRFLLHIIQFALVLAFPFKQRSGFTTRVYLTGFGSFVGDYCTSPCSNIIHVGWSFWPRWSVHPNIHNAVTGPPTDRVICNVFAEAACQEKCKK